MIERERAILAELMPGKGQGAAWMRPMDLGVAMPSRAKSVYLARMAARGWVEFTQRGLNRPGSSPRDAGMSRGSKAYRITAAGAQALANARVGDEAGRLAAGGCG